MIDFAAWASGQSKMFIFAIIGNQNFNDYSLSLSALTGFDSLFAC
jgi:hypothetical protein